MLRFQCKDCKIVFEAIGVKDERVDPVYGPCFKYMSECPLCHNMVDEYRPPKVDKGKPSACSNSGCCKSCSHF